MAAMFTRRRRGENVALGLVVGSDLRHPGRMSSPPGVRRARSRRAALLATLGALALSGCMRMDVDITLSEEDTATGTFVVAVSDQLAESIGMDPQELWQEGSGEIAGDLPEGATEEPYAEDGYTGARYTFAEESIETFSGTEEEDLTIRREGEEYVVTGTMDLTDASTEAEDVPQEVLDSFDMRVAITFPGEVTESSGTIEGNTVVWRPPFGERTELTARGSAVANPDGANAEETTAGEGSPNDDGATGDSGSGFPWWAVVLAAVGLLLLGLVAWLVVRANRPREAEAPAGYASPQTGPAPPPGYVQPPSGYVQPPPGPSQPPPGAVGPPYTPPPSGAPSAETPPDPAAPPSGEPRPPAQPQ
jgi:hypothetical protein